MSKLKSFITLTLIVAAGLFIIQNSVMVEIQFLVWNFSAPRALLVLLLLCIGFVLGFIASGFFSFKSDK